MSNTLGGRVYIITGGSKGFGLAIARSLVALGARVGLMGRNQPSLDEAVASFDPAIAYGVAADVAKMGQVRQAFSRFMDHFGRLDGLINNAGMARPGCVEKLLEDEVLAQINTNFLGTVFCCQAAIPLLRGGENPRIINVSSASAVHFDEMSHLSIYAASKAAVERFTRDLRIELQVDDIGVTCIRPGAAWTNFSDGWESGAFSAGLEAWGDTGKYMDTGMDVSHVGDSVAYALSQPPGVAVDVLEIRPNQRVSKVSL
jgi:NAD(P)-dependent dehydrogenase (short-subunit alcohol dehydrogenase family)